jgi:soluble cytochrome b562
MSETTTSNVVTAFLAIVGGAGIIAISAALTRGQEINVHRQSAQPQLPDREEAETANESMSSEATSLTQDASTREVLEEPIPHQIRDTPNDTEDRRITLQEELVKIREAAEEEVPAEATEEEQEQIEDIQQALNEALSDTAAPPSKEIISKARDLLVMIENIPLAARKRLERRKKKFLAEVNKIPFRTDGDNEGTHQAAQKEALAGLMKHLADPLTVEAMENAEAALHEYRETMKDIGAQIDQTFTTVERNRSRPRLTPEERRQRRTAEILRIKNEIVAQTIGAIGRFPLSTKPGREGCVAYGPPYSVPRDMAAEVMALLREMEGQVLVGGVRCHIVRKGGHTYNLTLQRNYAARYTRDHNPRTAVIMHIS